MCLTLELHSNKHYIISYPPILICTLFADEELEMKFNVLSIPQAGINIMAFISFLFLKISVILRIYIGFLVSFI